MAGVLLAITRQKKKLRKVKYAGLRLGRDTFAFPKLAKASLRSLGIKDLWLLDSELPEDKLEQRNVRFLTTKRIQVHFEGDSYTSSLYDELLMLRKWASAGVHPLEEEEFRLRAQSLRNELEPLAHYMFDTPLKESIFSFFVGVKDVARSDTLFPEKSKGLHKMDREGSKQFKDAIMEVLRKPRELEEIVSLTGVNESNARRWLVKLENQGIVTKTRKRMGIGRPKNIYYLSQRLKLGNA